VTISRLGFWGSRVDEIVAVADMAPPFRGMSLPTAQAAAAKTFLRVDIEGMKKPVLLSVRHGRIMDVTAFNALMEWPAS